MSTSYKDMQLAGCQVLSVGIGDEDGFDVSKLKVYVINQILSQGVSCAVNIREGGEVEKLTRLRLLPN